MNIYFRILRYSPDLVSRLIKFFIFSTLGVLFSATYLGLLMPMLEVLFDNNTDVTIPALPDFAFTFDFVKGYFRHHFIRIIVEHGRMDALMFVCTSIVGSVFLANLFRYAERMTASRIKVDVVTAVLGRGVGIGEASVSGRARVAHSSLDINDFNEGEILKGSSDPDKDYMEKIHPEKMRLSLEYVRTRSMLVDIKVILQTVVAIFR
ncbi:MAG: hypothetical protein MUE95_08085 [Cyclobacteriaceae bacterium]|nr:hypothetical protein [Cyclobacteriaceae bacterium]